MKGYTDFATGFLGASAVATKPIGDTKYMDWERAFSIIKERVKKNPYIVVEAGLMEDWNNTSGCVFSNGKFVKGYVYGASCWATPILDIEGEEIECYTYEKPKGFTTDVPDWWTTRDDKR
jgi:hypothetical protein